MKDMFCKLNDQKLEMIRWKVYKKLLNEDEMLHFIKKKWAEKPDWLINFINVYLLFFAFTSAPIEYFWGLRIWLKDSHSRVTLLEFILEKNAICIWLEQRIAYQGTNNGKGGENDNSEEM